MMTVRKLYFCDNLDEEESFVGCCALHYAALTNHKDIISLLYEFGADGSIQNTKGNTAADLATDTTRKLMETLEKEKQSKRNSDVFRRVKLKDILHTELVGQDLAIDQITSVVTRMETGWVNDKHPIVLLFVGATGLGKTEMVKILARYSRGSARDSFLHINLSEYQTEHEAAKFLGAPPGYVGYSGSSEGKLISLLARNPKAVVLFDEADKAHPDVLSTLLQLFDEGRLTSGSGKTVECTEAIFIMTANLALELISEFGKQLRLCYGTTSAGSAAGRSIVSQSGNADMTRQEYIHYFKSKLLHGPLKAAFKRDELLGRINELAIFIPFSVSEQRQVIENQLMQVRAIAARQHGVTLTWESSVLDLLGKAFNETYGARYMRHEIDRRVVSKLSKAMDCGLYRPGEFLHLEVHSILDDETGSDGHPAQHIRLSKLSPLNKKEDLDIHFADLSELFRINTS